MTERVKLGGRRFGRLTVTSISRSTGGKVGAGRREWKCVCSCGSEFWVRADNLLAGRTKSCGFCPWDDSTAPAEVGLG